MTNKNRMRLKCGNYAENGCDKSRYCSVDPSISTMLPMREIEIPVRESKIVFDYYLKIRQDTVELPDGTLMDYTYADKGEAVIVIPILDDGSIVMLREYRYPLHKMICHLPGGMVEEEETVEEAAHKELAEEGGFTAGRLDHVHDFYQDTGKSAMIIHAYVARKLEQAERNLEPSEFSEVEIISRREFEGILREKQVEATITAAYYMAKEKGLIFEE